jgi:hypothetical protein
MEEDGGLWVWKWKTREAKESLAVGTGLVEAPPSMHHSENGKARAPTMHDQRTKTLKAAYKSRAATATHLPMTTHTLVRSSACASGGLQCCCFFRRSQKVVER